MSDRMTLDEIREIASRTEGFVGYAVTHGGVGLNLVDGIQRLIMHVAALEEEIADLRAATTHG